MPDKGKAPQGTSKPTTLKESVNGITNLNPSADKQKSLDGIVDLSPQAIQPKTPQPQDAPSGDGSGESDSGDSKE